MSTNIFQQNGFFQGGDYHCQAKTSYVNNKYQNQNGYLRFIKTIIHLHTLICSCSCPMHISILRTKDSHNHMQV